MPAWKRHGCSHGSRQAAWKARTKRPNSFKAARLHGVSPIVATVVLIAVAMGLIVIVSPWVVDMAARLTNTTGGQAIADTICNTAGLAFVTSYGTNGASWNISGANDTLSAMVENTGNVDLGNFSFVLTVNATTAIQVYEYRPTFASQNTTNPLRPSRKAVLHANMTDDSNGTATYLEVVNGACRKAKAEMDL